MSQILMILFVAFFLEEWYISTQFWKALGQLKRMFTYQEAQNSKILVWNCVFGITQQFRSVLQNCWRWCLMHNSFVARYETAEATKFKLSQSILKDRGKFFEKGISSKDDVKVSTFNKGKTGGGNIYSNPTLNFLL